MSSDGPPPKRTRHGGGATCAVTQIGSISAGQSGISVRARLVNKSNLSPSDWNRHSYVELLDSTGEIRCGFNSAFRNKIASKRINGVYIFTNLAVRPISEEYRRRFGIPVEHQCELVLRDESEITHDYQDSDVPHRLYDFRNIRELKDMLEERYEGFVDFIGVCVQIKRDMIRQNNTNIRDLVLVDDSAGQEPHNSFKLSVWGAPARQLPKVAPKVPFIVIMKRARLSHFEDGRLDSGVTKMPLIPSLPNLLPNPHTETEEKRLLDWYRATQRNQSDD